MRRRWTLALVAATACYDSTWGQAKREQQHYAQHYTPPTLSAGAPDPKARALSVRLWIAPAYAAQSPDAERDAREIVGAASDVLSALGARLSVDSVARWADAPAKDDLPSALEALRKSDPGDGCAWVIGLVGGLPRFTPSFHDLGYAEEPGKHLVVRASANVEETDNIHALDELPAEDRSRLVRDRRRHKEVALLLHEIAHTLGAVHETARDQVMMPAYAWTLTGFGPATTNVVRAGLARRGTPEELGVEFRKELLVLYERSDATAWVDEERASLVARLRASLVKPDEKPAEATPAVATLSDAPPPELAPKDASAWARVIALVDAKRPADARDALAPLVKAYPESPGVQDARCKLAMAAGLEWKDAKAECAAVLRLSKKAPR